jgi:flagellar motor switch protein FliM
MVSPNEIVVIVVLNVKIKDVEGTLSFCIPYIILEPVLEHLNTRYWFTERKTSDEDKKSSRDLLTGKMNAVPMELYAILGTSRLTLREIMELHIGDVLQLDQHISDKAVVKSNNTDWFTGTVGLYQNHMAVRVENILMEGVVDHGTKRENRTVAG